MARHAPEGQRPSTQTQSRARGPARALRRLRQPRAPCISRGAAALFFAFFKIIGSYSGSIPFLPDFKQVRSSEYIYLMLPYIVTMIVLILTSKKSRAPKAEGIPYDKGAR